MRHPWSSTPNAPGLRAHVTGNLLLVRQGEGACPLLREVLWKVALPGEGRRVACILVDMTEDPGTRVGPGPLSDRRHCPYP